MLIALAGLPGVGKSTFARELQPDLAILRREVALDILPRTAR